MFYTHICATCGHLIPGPKNQLLHTTSTITLNRCQKHLQVLYRSLRRELAEANHPSDMETLKTELARIARCSEEISRMEIDLYSGGLPCPEALDWTLSLLNDEFPFDWPPQEEVREDLPF